MGRLKGVGKGHKLSDYIKLNDKPQRRTRKFKKNTWNEGFLGRTETPTRYDSENLLTGSY